jgi:signal transduction histidine kinase
MLLQTFKGRILAVALGMTMLSVLIFGYGLSGIYQQHMHKCLNRSLSFLTNMLAINFDVKNYSPAMQAEMLKNSQLQNILNGGLIHSIRLELLTDKPLSDEDRIYQFKKIDDTHYFSVSSSTQKINEEVFHMISDKWIFFFFGFVFTSLVIYLLVRLLFAPFNQLVNHCLTCEDPNKQPEGVTGGAEITTMRDAISTLQQRISALQKEQQETMKALTHELKTPLAQLRLRIDLANEKGKWSAESVIEAKKEIDEISQKITQILHSRKTNKKVQTIELKSSIEKITQELEPLWQHRELSFALDLLQEKSLELPQEAFERVLRILIENSINHSQKGAQIDIYARDGLLKITNLISQDTNKIIDSTGKGLEIAKTLCEYYSWELHAQNINAEYEIELKLPLT